MRSLYLQDSVSVSGEMMVYSFIVPIYKVESLLDRCVRSICEQTYDNIEIILVDDGSPDNCPQMCDEYAKKDARIKVLHKVNGGLSDARNKGLEIATGDYVIFVDADDYVEKDTCEKFLNGATQGFDILIGGAFVEGGVYDVNHIQTDGVMTGEEYLKKALNERKFPVVAWINAYNRKFLIDEGLKFKFGILHEDVEFTPRAFLSAKSVIKVDNVFYHYVIRQDSITKQKDMRKNAKDLFETCCEHENRFSKIENVELRSLLLDWLVNSYLSLFQSARLYKYGKEYIHKRFCKRNAYLKKTKAKSLLFRMSPRLYWHVNQVFKKIS